MRGEQFRFQAMLAPREGRGSSFVAKNGHTALGQCGAGIRMGILLDFEDERAHQIYSFMWADNFWIMSHSKKNLEQMPRDLIEEASRWDLVPKPACLWWPSTYGSEEKVDMILSTTSRCHKFPFEEKFKIQGYALNRQGKSQDSIEERMQSANNAFWQDILKNSSKDVPWKCQRLADHVYAVFAFGVPTLDKINGLSSKNAQCNVARKAWIQMGLPFLYEVIAESMWRATGWACDEKSIAVIDTLEKVYRWRSTQVEMA